MTDISSPPLCGQRERAKPPKAGTVAVAALALSFTVLFFAPAHIFFTNVPEFAYRFTGIVPVLAGVACCCASVLATVLLLVGKRLRSLAVALVLAVAWLSWVEGNVLVVDFGFFDGHGIAWRNFQGIRGVDYGVWAAGIATAVAFHRALASRAVVAGLLLVAMQAAGLAQRAWVAPPPDATKMFSVRSDRKFAFSSEQNVFIVVLDMFQSDVFEDLVKSDPSLPGEFDGFVNFRNTLGGFGATSAAMTFMLSGRLFDNSLPLRQFIEQSFLSERSIPAALLRAGFDVSIYSPTPQFLLIDPRVVSNLEPKQGVTWREVGRLLDLALFRYSPQDLKRLVFADNRWWLRRLAPATPVFPLRRGVAAPRTREFSDAELSLFDANDIVEPRWVSELEPQSRVVSAAPVMRLYHLRGPHYPFRMNERLAFETLPDTRQGYVRQATGSLITVARFLRRLRELGVYDRSLIIICGDHGYRGPSDGLVVGVQVPAGTQCPPPARAPGFADPNQKGSALPLLLVKRIGERGPLRQSDAAVSLGDLPVTVFRELGLPTRGDEVGIFDVLDPLRPRRFVQDTTVTPRRDGYFARMLEYEVRGLAWCDSSWRPTGWLSPPGQ